MNRMFLLPLLVVLCLGSAGAQDPPQFDPTLYEEFLKNNANLTYEGLQTLYPSGKFNPAARTDLGATEYLDSILLHYP
ncbi:MAG TPA: hypothetical protein VN824_20250, partial [Puia sp.]|nr:hypothetical protein [Puia sp.]